MGSPDEESRTREVVVVDESAAREADLAQTRLFIQRADKGIHMKIQHWLGGQMVTPICPAPPTTLHSNTQTEVGRTSPE